MDNKKSAGLLIRLELNGLEYVITAFCYVNQFGAFVIDNNSQHKGAILSV